MSIDNRENVINQLNDIASMVMQAAEADTLEQSLQRIADASRRLVNARYAALGVPDGQGGLRFFKVSGLSQAEIDRIDHPPVGEGLIGAIMNEQETVRLPHMKDDPRAVGFPEGHPPMDSMLGVPILVGEQLFGMLYLTDRADGQPFSLADQWLVETLAGYAALAIAGTRLRDQQRRLTLLEERQRIGMGLHDGVIQSLYAIGMHVDLMRQMGNPNPSDFEIVIDGLNEVIEDIRGYVMDLKSQNYHKKTLREALQDILSQLYIPPDLQININAPDSLPPFEAKDFESICFMVREAISNVIRHAQAQHLTIRCWQEADEFHITIRDDGLGFDPNDPANQNGLGLKNIQERARQHQGQALIESQPGKGTSLRIQIPVA